MIAGQRRNPLNLAGSKGRKTEDLSLIIPGKKQPHRGDCRCGVCAGADNDPRGQNIRCYGWTAEDGWIHCSRVPSRWPDPNGSTWAHPPNAPMVALPAFEAQAVVQGEHRRRKALEEVMAASLPASAPEAAPIRLYLASRGITDVPSGLRFHECLPYYEHGMPTLYFPAMLAILKTVTGKRKAIQRTYLTALGQKAPVLAVRKIMPSAEKDGIRGCAVQLGEPGHRLAIAEGVETALAYHQLKGWTTWAALSTSGMVSVQISAWVQEVIIAADHDKAGQRAARQLARRLLGEGLRVRIDTPPIPGQDWNDVLIGGLA